MIDKILYNCIKSTINLNYYYYYYRFFVFNINKKKL